LTNYKTSKAYPVLLFPFVLWIYHHLLKIFPLN
jgi:hypothetical protein